MELDGLKKLPPPFNWEQHLNQLKTPPPRPRRKIEAVGVVPLTEEEWTAFEGKARWDSQVALRGPDLKHSETLKWFTTSVIRRKLSQIMRVGGMVNTSLPCVVIPHSISGAPAGFDASHFIGHVIEAANWLQIPIVKCSAEVWAEMLQGANHITILKLLSVDKDNIDRAYRKVFAEILGVECPE